MPRTTKHTVNKPVPQLRECCLDALAQTTDEWATPARLLWCDEQHLGFLRQQGCQWSTSIATITQHNAAINCLRKCSGHISLIRVGWRQRTAQHFSRLSCDDMQLEAEIPARRRFTEISPVFSQQSHTSMPDRFADRNRLGIHQIKRCRLEITATCGFNQLPNKRREQMQPMEPLFVRAQPRKGAAKVRLHEQVSALQGGAAEGALQKRNGQDFGIGESRTGMRRASPVSAARMGFEKIINEDVDFCHLMFYAAHGRCPPAGGDKVSQLHSTHLLGGNDL